ncbi:hypothetical protein HZ326_16776 [Fusarium oxysporum f. sp. albedinis]|nr:hypothetical protein HZ326_16776 [Fusarium oxysporum f. sp. albedinis]
MTILFQVADEGRKLNCNDGGCWKMVLSSTAYSFRWPNVIATWKKNICSTCLGRFNRMNLTFSALVDVLEYPRTNRHDPQGGNIMIRHMTYTAICTHLVEHVPRRVTGCHHGRWHKEEHMDTTAKSIAALVDFISRLD